MKFAPESCVVHQAYGSCANSHGKVISEVERVISPLPTPHHNPKFPTRFPHPSQFR